MKMRGRKPLSVELARQAIDTHIAKPLGLSVEEAAAAIYAVQNAQTGDLLRQTVVEAGHDPRRFATDLLDRLRDLIVLDAVPEAGGNGLLDVPPDRLELMSAQAQALGPATLSRMARSSPRSRPTRLRWSFSRSRAARSRRS